MKDAREHVNKDLATENFALGMQVHNLTKERDHYKEKANENLKKYQDAVATDLSNQRIQRKSKKFVAIRCLLVGAAIGALAIALVNVFIKM